MDKINLPSDPPIGSLPSLPHSVVAKMMETYKNEVETRCKNCMSSIPDLIESAIDHRNLQRQIKLRSQLKYLIGSLPGGLLVWILENLVL